MGQGTGPVVYTVVHMMDLPLLRPRIAPRFTNLVNSPLGELPPQQAYVGAALPKALLGIMLRRFGPHRNGPNLGTLDGLFSPC